MERHSGDIAWPSTPAEVARAHRLAEVAETVHGRAGATSPTRPA